MDFSYCIYLMVGNDPFNVASVGLSQKINPKKQRVIHCHDMKGGYLEDRFPHGLNGSLGYNFPYWKVCVYLL